MGIHELERLLIGGLLKHKHEAFSQIEGKIGPKFFSNPREHQNIFSTIVDAIQKKDFFDPTTIARQLIGMGISNIHGCPTLDYLESISLTTVQKQAIPAYAQTIFENCQLTDAQQRCSEIIKYINDSKVNQPYNEVISNVDRLFSEIDFKFFKEDNRGRPLLEGAIEEIEERRKNPIDELGYSSPFPIYNNVYGEYEPGELYIYVARPGVGKSTWLMHMGFEMAFKYKIPCLFLDTEMHPKQVQYRLLASLTKIPIADLRYGQREDGKSWTPDQVSRWEEVKKNLGSKDSKYKLLHHEQVGDYNIDELISFVKHWRLSTVGRNNPCFVIYDYIKRTGETISNHEPEWLVIGDKTQKLKNLAVELEMPILTAVQSNKTAVTANKDYDDDNLDSSTIGLSDRILHLASFAGSLVDKTPKQLTLDNRSGRDWGTHKLICHKARNLGRGWRTHVQPVMRTFPSGVEKPVRNYISYNIENFEVSEKGLLSDILAAETERHTHEDENSGDGDLL